MYGSLFAAIVGVAVAAFGLQSAAQAWELRAAAPHLWSIPDTQSLSAQLSSLQSEVAALKISDATLTVRNTPYIVISIGDRSLDFHQGSKLRHLPAAVGMGKTFLDGKPTFFETPTGRFSIRAKEEAPVWQAPDWHYRELATKGGGKMVPLSRSSKINLSDGRTMVVQGDDVGTVDEAGTFTPFGMGQNLIFDGKVYMPPSGTQQRFYPEVLGTRRLKLGDAYAIHGTNKPGSVGRAASHGCVRLTNADIESIYDDVKVGTPVFIY